MESTMTTPITTPMITFQDLNLPSAILRVITELGYEIPTPIQQEAIPCLMAGSSLLAQSKTGSGKTASFALPIITKLNPEEKGVQALVLAPTRELALQVAEAFKTYTKYMNGVRVLPIYGGQSFRDQLHALKDGVQIIVGTPGRIMDHMERGTLSLNNLKTLVLDEADEMLNMGFIDDIKWILEKIPAENKVQKALFSATVPSTIAKLVKEYMGEVQKIQINSTVNQVETIKQFFCVVPESYKLEALSRFLETQTFDAAIVFTATKTATVALSDALYARGYSVDAINGDMTQEDREKIIKRLKSGAVNIVVATDVAARGLDVDRIGLVVNFDVPFNPDSYVHRIGRTGRAGREGVALLLITPNQRHLLRIIERVTQKTVEELKPPTAKQVNEKRFKNFAATVHNVLKTQELQMYREQVSSLLFETDYSEVDIASALVSLAQKDIAPLNPKEDFVMSFNEYEPRNQPRRNDRPRQSQGAGAGAPRNNNRRPFDNKRSERNDRPNDRPAASGAGVGGAPQRKSRDQDRKKYFVFADQSKTTPIEVREKKPSKGFSLNKRKEVQGSR
jgi:ATP-dependent RNA helicase DeaD